MADDITHCDQVGRERIAALDRRLTEQMAAADRATGVAMTAAEKAVNKAEAASEKRFESINEFRQTLSDQAQTFISRGEVTAMMDAMKANVARIDGQQATVTGRGAGADYMWRAIATIAGVLLVAAGLIFAISQAIQ